MIRLLISVALALVVANSAEAMSPAPLHQPDGMITQIRKARQCKDPNQVRINGICQYLSFPLEADTWPMPGPQPNTAQWYLPV